MLNKIAAFSRGNSALHGCNKARFPLDRLEFRFLFGSERYFHSGTLGPLQLRVNAVHP
jgi:hypothetical protein